MKKSNLVPIKETAFIALGELVVSLLIIGVFLIIQKYDYTVLTGVILGSAVIIINFLVMSILISRALDEAFAHRDDYVAAVPTPAPLPEDDSELDDGNDEDINDGDDAAAAEPNPELESAMRFLNDHTRRVQNISRVSYIVRTVAMLGALVLALVSGWFNAIAVCIPMLMLRPIIMVEGLLRRKK